jgi:DNA damage-binding protein 1
VGEQTISYHSTMLDTFRSVVPQSTIFECFNPVKESGTEEWLLGDAEGRIYSLTLLPETLILQPLGTVSPPPNISLTQTSIPSVLVSLSPTQFFVGSHFNDSLLLTTTPTLHTHTTLLTNLSPISDFLILPPSHPQSGTLITCSGGFGQGTLRIIRQGVGMEESAAVDFDGIRGLWTLPFRRPGDMAVEGGPPTRLVLVVAGIARTVALEMDCEGGLEVLEGFDALVEGEESIEVTEREGTVVQVTTERVRVTTLGGVTAEFLGKISAAKVSQDKIVISSGRELTMLDFECRILHTWPFPEEITCVDFQFGDLIAVGLWNSTALFIPLSTGIPTPLPDTLSAPARSILLTDILGAPTVLIGSRDGTLTTYSLVPHPKDKKVISLGTQPLGLFAVKTSSKDLIFASSDRPTILHSPPSDRPDKKFTISAFSVRDVICLTPLHHVVFPDSLVLATKEGFKIGKMDQMTRLQVRTVSMPNSELPRRIARAGFSEMGIAGEAGLVGVVSLKVHIEVDGHDSTEGYFRVWDEDSWQCNPPSGRTYG